ncbi:uncharacterized protein LOC118182772 [Stegodyphus dumicola]|uniref:uncharacterized protein LOC118182772 n=1 Tax=Stegodyphus dumicola TaxID=202533 RepID=UPI0015AE0CA1|nr:uncharacterized protein LOC118182772 [Stegodyphus dumicola]
MAEFECDSSHLVTKKKKKLGMKFFYSVKSPKRKKRMQKPRLSPCKASKHFNVKNNKRYAIEESCVSKCCEPPLTGTPKNAKIIDLRKNIYDLFDPTAQNHPHTEDILPPDYLERNQEDISLPFLKENGHFSPVSYGLNYVLKINSVENLQDSKLRRSTKACVSAPVSPTQEPKMKAASSLCCSSFTSQNTTGKAVSLPKTKNSRRSKEDLTLLPSSIMSRLIQNCADVKPEILELKNIKNKKFPYKPDLLKLNLPDLQEKSRELSCNDVLFRETFSPHRRNSLGDEILSPSSGYSSLSDLATHSRTQSSQLIGISSKNIAENSSTNPIKMSSSIKSFWKSDVLRDFGKLKVDCNISVVGNKHSDFRMFQTLDQKTQFRNTTKIKTNDFCRLANSPSHRIATTQTSEERSDSLFHTKEESRNISEDSSKGISTDKSEEYPANKELDIEFETEDFLFELENTDLINVSDNDSASDCSECFCQCDCCQESNISENNCNDVSTKSLHASDDKQETKSFTFLVHEPIIIKYVDEEEKAVKELLMYSSECLEDISKLYNKAMSQKEVLECLRRRSKIYEGKPLRIVLNLKETLKTLKDETPYPPKSVSRISSYKTKSNNQSKFSVCKVNTLPQSHSAILDHRDDVQRSKTRELKKFKVFTKLQSCISNINKSQKITNEKKAHSYFVRNETSLLIAQKTVSQENSLETKTHRADRRWSTVTRKNIDEIISHGFKDRFHFYAKLGGRLKSGVVISKSNSNYWLRKCGIIYDQESLKAADECFAEFARKKIVLNICDYMDYLKALSRRYRISLEDLVELMVGEPYAVLSRKKSDFGSTHLACGDESSILYSVKNKKENKGSKCLQPVQSTPKP